MTSGIAVVMAIVLFLPNANQMRSSPILQHIHRQKKGASPSQLKQRSISANGNSANSDKSPVQQNPALIGSNSSDTSGVVITEFLNNPRLEIFTQLYETERNLSVSVLHILENTDGNLYCHGETNATVCTGQLDQSGEKFQDFSSLPCGTSSSTLYFCDVTDAPECSSADNRTRLWKKQIVVEQNIEITALTQEEKFLEILTKGPKYITYQWSWECLDKLYKIEPQSHNGSRYIEMTSSELVSGGRCPEFRHQSRLAVADLWSNDDLPGVTHICNVSCRARSLNITPDLWTNWAHLAVSYSDLSYDEPNKFESGILQKRFLWMSMGFAIAVGAFLVVCTVVSLCCKEDPVTQSLRKERYRQFMRERQVGTSINSTKQSPAHIVHQEKYQTKQDKQDLIADASNKSISVEKYYNAPVSVSTKKSKVTIRTSVTSTTHTKKVKNQKNPETEIVNSQEETK